MRITDFACKYFDTNIEDLKGKTDYKNTLPRHMVWYYMHNVQGFSNMRIAKLFSRDKRTVIYGISNMKYRIERQQEYCKLYEKFVNEYEKETAE